MTTEPAMTFAAPRTGPLPVTVLCGFLGSGMPGEGERFKAARLFITYCATDARPVSTLIEAEEAPRIPEMTWLKVTGIAISPILNGKRTAIIRAASVQPAARIRTMPSGAVAIFKGRVWREAEQHGLVHRRQPVFCGEHARHRFSLDRAGHGY